MHSTTVNPTVTRRLTLRRATNDDLRGVLSLLAETAGWLNGRGVRQWPAGGFPAERISPLIEEGVLYLLDGERGEEGPAATIALDGHADPEFWAAEDAPGRLSTFTSCPSRATTPAAAWGRHCSTGRA